MKRQVKRTTLNGLSSRVWQCIAGCLLAPGIVLAQNTVEADYPPFDQSESFDSHEESSFQDDQWEPDLSLGNTTDSGFTDPVEASPLIPWDPRITQSLLPIDQPTHSANGNAFHGVEGKVLTPEKDDLIAIDLPSTYGSSKPQSPGPNGVLPSERVPPGTLPYNANTIVTPQSLIAQEGGRDTLAGQLGSLTQNPQSILINFNNVGMIEFVRFVSRISGRNFIFNDQDLQFNVTIVSEDPTTIDNIMTILLQELRIHQLYLIEQGNNFIIHTNPNIQGATEVLAEGLPLTESQRQAQIVTQVFRLNTLVPTRAATIIKPLLSDVALIETMDPSSQLIVTDLAPNIQKIGQLLKSLDSPLSGLVIGQYLVLNAFPDTLIPLAEKIMAPIAEGKPLVFVPHGPSNSIFIVSNPFLVERTIAVLSNLDINVGATRIFSPDALRFVSPNNPFSQDRPGQTNQYGLPPAPGGAGAGGAFGPGGAGGGAGYPGGEGGPGGTGFPPGTGPGGGPLYGPNGELLTPGGAGGGIYPGAGGTPPGLPGQGPGTIQPGGPGAPPPGLPGQPFVPGGPIQPGRPFQKELPPGHINRTQFSIYKLRYRRGAQLQTALNNIATSLQSNINANPDLIQSLNSMQYIETTNSLVFSGSPETIQRVLELIMELDIPLRQVFIEVLVLDTTITDSLTYGVNWQTRFFGLNYAGGESFLTNNPITGALNTANLGLQPDATSLLTQSGFSLGLIGRTISHNGKEYATIAGLVRAIHLREDSNIIMSPKIICEDNATAEIFVGINTSFQTSSIANDRGNIVTTNVDFRDVGTRLKVTPLLSNTDIITMDIEQTISRVVTQQSRQTSLVQSNPGPTTSQNNTKTRVHIPNGYFLVLSGMIQDEDSHSRQQVPCLGGIPVIGALFSQKENNETKRNVMIFLRPQIVDTEEEIESITKQQQDVWHQKNRIREMYKYEVDEALDFFNVQPEDCCDDFERKTRNDYLHCH